MLFIDLIRFIYYNFLSSDLWHNISYSFMNKLNKIVDSEHNILIRYKNQHLYNNTVRFWWIFLKKVKISSHIK